MDSSFFSQQMAPWRPNSSSKALFNTSKDCFHQFYTRPTRNDYMKSGIGMVRFFYCLSNNYVKDVNNNYDVQGEPLQCEKKSFRDQFFKNWKKKSLAAIFHNHPECQNKSCQHFYISKLNIFKDFFHLTTALTVYIRVNGK
jgi:hypothetical protein